VAYAIKRSANTNCDEMMRRLIQYVKIWPNIQHRYIWQSNVLEIAFAFKDIPGEECKEKMAIKSDWQAK